MRFTSLQTRLVVIFSLCLLVTIGAITIYGVSSSQHTEEFIINSSNEVASSSRYNLIWQVSVGLGITLIALIVIWFVSKSITRPLKTAAAVATQVSEGHLGIQFDSRSRDEVGQVLRAMGKMIAYLKDVANVAEKISNNDLQIEITPKSEQDALNHSLIKTEF